MNEFWDSFESKFKKEAKLTGSLIGVSIRSRKSGELEYEHMGNIRLHPASNLKLFTCAAGLDVLGEDYLFKTELWTDGEIVDERLLGNLYLKGKGDPTLLIADFERFAHVLKERGISQITGNIIGDDSWYDSVRLSKDLNWSDEHCYYGAQVSALTASPTEDYDSGTIMLEISPTNHAGDSPNITVTPENDYVQIINKAITSYSTTSEEEPELTITRRHGENLVIVEGIIPTDSEAVREWIAIWEPTYYALHLFQQALSKKEIKLNGNIITGTTPSQALLISECQSMPLAELCTPFMKLSNNGHGEVLVKEMGKVMKGDGSWDSGLEVLNSRIQEWGVDIEKLVVRDGSGISHVNLVPANEISKLLFHVQKEKWFPSFYQSLPVAGDQNRMVGGTLRDRLDGLNVNAKTGTIMGVSTLSGYLTTREGEELIFSIMLNNLLDEEDGPPIIDRLVKYIVTEKNRTIVS
ncbi:D-alanyl-D-alanine carboxypeptidase/D-alanyl-D-alanine endopeptidase [Ornithinibacillus xuwenensis]|uniref:D-alanyl-D-alanine carboxypeptidase/D-alanyl-D-alanine-endopeptidase n=1 Tax=Ornithinibacillus xuwenensis TaxID=3144668 RepID=A0ABU9XEE7_9BACI